MKKFASAFVLLLVVSAMPAWAQQVSQPDITGVYEVTGQNPDGSVYEGFAEVERYSETYRVKWTLSDGNSVIGVAMLSDGIFAVSYFTGTPTVVVYKIDGQRLVGEWVMGGVEGKTYPEILTKTDKAIPAPPPSPAPAKPPHPPINPQQIRVL